MSFYQKIGQGWKDFWVREPYGYYSINLLYGPKVLGSSFMWMWNKRYVFVLFLLVLYVYFNKKIIDIKKYFIYLSIAFFGIFGIRFLYDSYGIYKDDMNLFVNKPIEQKTFRNYNDIYTFVDFIKTHIASGSKIQFISYQDWPYKGFAGYQLWPFIQIDNNADTIVVYDTGKFKFENTSLLDTTTNQVILSGITLVKKYNAFSYILKKF